MMGVTQWVFAAGAMGAAATSENEGGAGPAALDVKCDADAWWGAIVGSLMVGAVGVLPLFLFSNNDDKAAGGQMAGLRTMLGCACGGLLGNTFLHLLPESYAAVGAMLDQRPDRPIYFLGMVPVTAGHHGFGGDMYIGLWVLLGILAFLCLEKLAAAFEDGGGVGEAAEVKVEPELSKKKTITHRKKKDDDREGAGAGEGAGGAPPSPSRQSMSEMVAGAQHVDPAGYLNLLVNTLDNFTHGLAIAAAFCNSSATGITTTIAIVIHEVPHEVGDYAILLNSGFTKLHAITAQFATSAGGLLGALYGLYSSEAEAGTLWIYPFAAGGFIYIALVSLIPDMINEESTMPWWRDVLHITCGAMIVGAVAQFHEDH
jgi:zinc transporter 13